MVDSHTLSLTKYCKCLYNEDMDLNLGKKHRPKLEKTMMPKEEAFEKTWHLFESVGKESVQDNSVVIENDSIKIAFERENITFSTSQIPKTEDEMLDSKISVEERRLLRFLDFEPDLFYQLKSYHMRDKITGSALDLETELEGTTVYVKKNGQNPMESAADYLENCIKVGIEPKSAAGILIMFHEIGHKRDPLLVPFGSKLPSREYKSTNNADEDRLDQERFAWAYCLKKIKTFLSSLNVSGKDMDVFVHQWALGTYSAAIDTTRKS